MGSAASAPLSADLAVSINSFGNSLLGKLITETKSSASAGIFVSPYGIAQAVAMLLNGVEPGGQSYRQLQEVVFGAVGGHSLSLEELNSQLKALTGALAKETSEDLTVSAANSAWLAQRYRLQPRYAQALQDAFVAQAAPLTSAAAINDWVAEATRGLIKGIVDEAAVQQAVFILVNALYFKGIWQHQFKKAATFPSTFHQMTPTNSNPFQAATMFQLFKPASSIQTAVLPAVVDGSTLLDCPAVRLPYKGGEYFAVAAMPAGQLSRAEADHSADSAATKDSGSGDALGLVTASGATVPYAKALASCRQALLSSLPSNGTKGGAVSINLWHVSDKDVKLFLPRFEVEFFTSLNGALQELGLTQPFEGGDLTQIAADSQGNALGDLFVSDVLHKVYAKVDEAGTEAAAATAVVMCRSAFTKPRPEIELRFDRPFVFAVVHGGSGVTLFCGEVHRPEEWRQEKLLM